MSDDEQTALELAAAAPPAPRERVVLELVGRDLDKLLRRIEAATELEAGYLYVIGRQPA